ncbi:MAG: SLC13 family permease [Betaproteobacteria bacterium]|nr:SLC13 family permease [Betaproteobacteria bacterium]
MRTVLKLAIVLVAAIIFFVPPPPGVSPVVMRTAGLVVFTVGMWATQGLPEHITGLLFLLLAVLIEVAPASVVFSGFTSGTLWLVLGGLFIAEAVRVTGLGERFALALLGRFTGSYSLLVSATVVVATALCFVMPATLGRVLLLVPILSGLARHIGLAAGSSGHTGLMLAAIVASFQIGTSILPANAPNLVLAGAAEAVHGIHLDYGEYLWVQFPVLGLAKMALIVAATCWLFPARIERAAGVRAVSRMSAKEIRLSLILLAALALWTTDVVHGIRPGWIALAAGLAVMLPRIGVMPLAAFNDSIKYGPYFYIGAVLGLGAVVTQTGTSAALGALVLPALALVPGEDFRNFMLLAIAATIACMVTTNPAQPGLMVPLGEQIAAATGWSLQASLMTAALGFSNIMLPYAVPPLVVGMQLTGIGLRAAARYTLLLALPSFAVLLPLDYLWWRFIGYFG